MKPSPVDAVLEHYPRIYFACHTRHARDPRTGETLSSHQVSILDHLSRTDPTSLAELAAHMGVTASTMSLAVDRLEAQGYVLRESHSVLDRQKVGAMLARLSETARASAVRGLELLALAATREIEAHAGREATA